MDLMGRKRLREKERQLAIKKVLEEEKAWKEGNKPYSPSTKKLLYLLVILVLGTAAYMMWDYKVIVNNECNIMPAVECSELKVTNSGISFTIRNFLKEDLNITASVEGCNGNVTNYIRPNMDARYTFTCPIDEKNIERKIPFTYVGYSGLPHDKVGSLLGKVE
jgi:hypothetical protein